jgi:DNA polymerase V
MIALIDCNNFFVSCERAFNPKLMGKPVVVLSNNGGCVIARSNEAKDLLIPMGAPYFKIKHIIERHHVQVLTTNFDLYHDLSQRIMRIINETFPLVEVYSVDEAFIDLKGMDNIFYHLSNLQNYILKGLGIPTTIGIASTKTLAKIANYDAKKKRIPCLQIDDSTKDNLLLKTPIGEIWGIGRNLVAKFKSQGFYSAHQLMCADPRWAKKVFSVVSERIVRELNGIRCLDINDIDNPQKSIQVSRSFVTPLTTVDDIENALSTFVEQLCQKLRVHNLKTKNITFYMKSSPFVKPSYYDSKTITFERPVDDPISMMSHITPKIEPILKKGVLYKKIGVGAIDLLHNTTEQKPLFGTLLKNHSTLFKSIDEINQKFGRKTVTLLSSGINFTSDLENKKRSPKYTTHWGDLMRVG